MFSYSIFSALAIFIFNMIDRWHLSDLTCVDFAGDSLTIFSHSRSSSFNKFTFRVNQLCYILAAPFQVERMPAAQILASAYFSLSILNL